MKKAIVVLLHAFVVWALCGATMGIGMAVTSIGNALIIHAVAAPIIASMVSLAYFRRFSYTSPLQTAIVFLAFVVLADLFVVSLLINRNLEMFGSILGTWIPFTLIFLSTYLTGLYIAKLTG